MSKSLEHSKPLSKFLLEKRVVNFVKKCLPFVPASEYAYAMLKNFNESQPIYAYKRYAYKKKCMVK